MAPEKAPAFQFYPKDFLTDEKVVLMSNTEVGLYIRLLCFCWLEGTLPLETDSLARMARMPLKQFTKLWEHSVVRTCFRVAEDGRLHHKRLDEERFNQDHHRQRQSDRGKEGAEARWHKHSARNAQAMPKHRPTDAPAMPQAMLRDSSSSPSPEKKESKERSLGPPKEPADPNVKVFLQWFPAEYKTRRHGADYVVKWEKDAPTVKTLLKATTLDRLQKCAQVMLSDKCEDDFIVTSDRGVGVLSAKFNWLSDRLASWEARQKAVTA